MVTLHSPRTAWLVGATIVALGGVAAAVWVKHDEAAEETNKPTPTVAVRVAELRPSVQGGTRSFTGSVLPRYQTDIAFRVSGKILRRHVEVGNSVTAGQLLFELDASDYELQLKSSEANLQSAKAAVLQAIAEEKRLKELRKSNAVSASEYDVGLSNRDIAIGRQTSAEKQLELARNQVAYCRLVADADGVITSVSAEAGQVVNLGSPVCSLAQLKELEAVIDIPENRWPSSHDQTTLATFWSLPGVQCATRLREISPTADPLTRTFRARFTLLNPPPEIKLGMTATVALNQAVAADSFDIPATSIIKSEGNPAVWRVDTDGSIVAIPVNIVHYSTDSVRVSGPLQPGDRVVSAGAHRLDAKVRVRTWEVQK